MPARCDVQKNRAFFALAGGAYASNGANVEVPGVYAKRWSGYFAEVC